MRTIPPSSYQQATSYMRENAQDILSLALLTTVGKTTQSATFDLRYSRSDLDILMGDLLVAERYVKLTMQPNTDGYRFSLAKLIHLRVMVDGMLVGNPEQESFSLGERFYEFEKLVGSFLWMFDEENDYLKDSDSQALGYGEKFNLARYIAIHDSQKACCVPMLFELLDASDKKLSERAHILRSYLKTKQMTHSEGAAPVFLLDKIDQLRTLLQSDYEVDEMDALVTEISKTVNGDNDHDLLLDTVEELGRMALADQQIRRQQLIAFSALMGVAVIALGYFKQTRLESTVAALTPFVLMLASCYVLNFATIKNASTAMGHIYREGVSCLKVNPNFPTFKVLQMQLPEDKAKDLSNHLGGPNARRDQIHFSQVDLAGNMGMVDWVPRAPITFVLNSIEQAVNNMGKTGLKGLISSTLIGPESDLALFESESSVEKEPRWIVFRLATNWRLSQNSFIKTNPSKQSEIKAVLLDLASDPRIIKYFGLESDLETDYFPEFFLRVISKHFYDVDNANSEKVQTKVEYLEFVLTLMPDLVVLALDWLETQDVSRLVNFNPLTDKVIAQLPRHKKTIDDVKTVIADIRDKLSEEQQHPVTMSI